MVENRGFRYLNIDLDLVHEFGYKAAALYAYLKACRIRPDKHGYVAVDHSRISEVLGLSKNELIRVRRKLYQAGKIDVIGGSNQNQKPRYKITK